VQLFYRSSVNRWECDENDHLNVRFYIEKHWQILAAGAHDLGMNGDPLDLQASISVQHLRFLKESRLAAPLSGFAGVVNSNDAGIDVLTELRHSFTDEVLCTCVHRITGITTAATDVLPDYAQGKGIADEDPVYARLALHELSDLGFTPISLGVVATSECGPAGVMAVHNYMGRISDGMPHLWGQLQAQPDVIDDTEGGAVLEFRIRYHRPLLSAHCFTVFSGIMKVGAKVQNFVHLMFDTTSGKISASAEAVGVRMDLRQRRAKTLARDRQALLTERMLKPIS
jgi:acyl-CoA thioester hydrolase